MFQVPGYVGLCGVVNENKIPILELVLGVGGWRKTINKQLSI